jgi:hypothetical protein
MNNILKNTNKGRKFEKMMAKVNNVSLIRGSGRNVWHKGDLESNEYLIECKYIIDKPSIRISSTIVNKIKEEAISTNKKWAIILGIEKLGQRFVIVEKAGCHQYQGPVVDKEHFIVSSGGFTFKIEGYTLVKQNEETLGSELIMVPMYEFRYILCR